MGKIRSRYEKQWVNLQFHADGEWLKLYIRKLTHESGFECYEAMWETGDIELIFVSQVHRILPVQAKKGRVVDLNKQRMKRLKLIECKPSDKI